MGPVGEVAADTKSVEVNWYPSDHYFPFPSFPGYNKKLADAAWARTSQFLHTAQD